MCCRFAILLLLCGIYGGLRVSVPAYAERLPKYPVKIYREPPPKQKPSRWRPGFQLGLNVSDYTNSPSINSDSRVGYIAGLELEYRINQTFFLQPEVRAVQKGFVYNQGPSSSPTNYDARVVYIELPLLVKAKFNIGYNISPFVFVGPDIGFNTSDSVDVTQNGNMVSGPPLTVLFKTVDFSMDEGAGVEYRFAPKMSGFLSFRASIGLINVSDLGGTNWKSRGYQFIFGGLFDLF